MKKNIVITGCAGFIGFHLARQLQAEGHHVIGYDNFNSYYSPELKCARALELENNDIEIVEGDICNMPLLQETIKAHKTTHLVHLAAQPGVRYSLVNPHEYIKTNVDGFLNVLECCRMEPKIKLIYASSSSVYGRQNKAPFSVQDRTDQQASLYGVTKKDNELMAQTYHELFGIPVTGLRFFSVYGPWGRPDMAYYSFTEAILAKQPIDVYNHGKMQRDFTYIDDIISGTIAAINLGADCEIFNLGNHQPVALTEFIQILEMHLGEKAIINYLPMQQGDVEITYADIDYSIEKLQFSPKIDLKEGLGRFVKWHQDYILSK